MASISNDIWVNLGKEFCLIKRHFRNKYFFLQENLGKHKIKQYFYSSINDIEFTTIQSNLDYLIIDYFDEDTYNINGVEITKVFYNNPPDNYNLNNIKTFKELIDEYSLYMDNLYLVFDKNYKFNKNSRTVYNKIKKIDKAFRNKLERRFNKGLITDFENNFNAK